MSLTDDAIAATCAHLQAFARPACCWQATVAKLFTIELCYLATITYHLYQLQTAPGLYAGAGSFSHAAQQQACTSSRDNFAEAPRLAEVPAFAEDKHVLLPQSCAAHRLSRILGACAGLQLLRRHRHEVSHRTGLLRRELRSEFLTAHAGRPGDQCGLAAASATLWQTHSTRWSCA